MPVALRQPHTVTAQPVVALEGKAVMIHCSAGNTNNHHVTFSWSSRNAVIDANVNTRGPRLELPKVKLQSAGSYFCIARDSNGAATTYSHKLHVVDMPIHSQEVATSQTEHDSIQGSRMLAHSCISPENQISHINLVQTEECAPAEDNQAYNIGIPRTTNLIYHEEFSRGKALRCKLEIVVNKASCGRGFAGMLRHSSILADVLAHKGLYPLNDKECKRFHEDKESTILLGDRRVTLKTGFLGSQTTIAYMNGDAFINGTCVGAETGETIWLGPTNPAVLSVGKEIIRNEFILTLETEQFELNLKTKVLSVPRLGLEVAVTDLGHINNTDNSGTITIDTQLIPKDECQQYHLIKTIESTLYEAQNPTGEQLYCKAILVTAPNGIQGTHELIYPESLPGGALTAGILSRPTSRQRKPSPGGSETALYRYTSTELHKLLGLYHLENSNLTGHEANFVRYDEEGTKFILKKPWAELYGSERNKDRWYITTTEGDAEVYSPGSQKFPGRRPLQTGKVHLSYNRKEDPIGDLHEGLMGSCVLNATKPGENQDGDHIPPILITKTQVGGKSKSIAYSLLHQTELCGEICYSTQTRGVFACVHDTFRNATSAAKNMKLGNQNENTLENLPSGSLNFLQISIDGSVSQIIHQLCEMRRKRIEAALSDFEKHGVREFFPPEDRSGLRSLTRGETGVIFSCKTLYVKPVTALPLCCANQPVRLIGEDETGEVRHFLTPVRREIVTACSPVQCSDILPITFYTDTGIPVCQSTKGLTHCSGGTISNPNDVFRFKFQPITKSQSILGWTQEMLASHMQHLISEIIAATSFQNSFVNTLATNALRCKGAVICKGSQTLANSISQEISRGTSNSLSFILNWTLVGEIAQGLILGTVVLFFSQGLIGMIHSLQRRCCRQGGRALTFCGCIGLFIRTIDRFLNPWSAQRHASGQRLIDLSLALQRMEMTVKALGDRLAHLDNMMDSFRETMPHNYETLTPTNQPEKRVTFRLEDTDLLTFMDHDGHEMGEVTTVDIHPKPLEIEEDQNPPPLPEKSNRRNKFAGITFPITSRPRLRKSKKQAMAGYTEMKRGPAPPKPPRLEISQEVAQILKPLLDE